MTQLNQHEAPTSLVLRLSQQIQSIRSGELTEYKVVFREASGCFKKFHLPVHNASPLTTMGKYQAALSREIKQIFVEDHLSMAINTLSEELFCHLNRLLEQEVSLSY